MQRNLGNIFILLIFFLLSCSTKSNPNLEIEGDYYVKLIDLRLYELPDTTLSKIESRDALAQDSMTKQEKWLDNYVSFLKREKLLRKPYIRLRQDDGEIKMVFMDKKDYEQIENLADNLKENGKKIRIRVEAREIKYDSLSSVYDAISLKKVEKIVGKTYYKK